MGYYRPRPSEVKSCKHCSTSFETNHKRAIYCGESCRQLAYQARHRSDQSEPPKAKGNSSSSRQDLGMAAAGSALAAIGNHYFYDQPAHEELLSKLNSIEKGTEQGLNQLLSAAQMMVDYVNLQVGNDFTLKMKMEKLHADRLQQQAQKERQKQLKSARLLAAKGG